MAIAEPLYQIGICPSCPSDAEQRLLFATEDWSYPITEKGKIVAYECTETLSLFSCQRCGGTLFYATQPDYPGPFSVDESDIHNPHEVATLTRDQFIENSTLMWPTKRDPLPPSVPDNVRKLYDGALRVKA